MYSLQLEEVTRVGELSNTSIAIASPQKYKGTEFIGIADVEGAFYVYVWNDKGLREETQWTNPINSCTCTNFALDPKGNQTTRAFVGYGNSILGINTKGKIFYRFEMLEASNILGVFVIGTFVCVISDVELCIFVDGKIQKRYSLPSTPICNTLNNSTIAIGCADGSVLLCDPSRGEPPVTLNFKSSIVFISPFREHEFIVTTKSSIEHYIPKESRTYSICEASDISAACVDIKNNVLCFSTPSEISLTKLFHSPPHELEKEEQIDDREEDAPVGDETDLKPSLKSYNLSADISMTVSQPLSNVVGLWNGSRGIIASCSTGKLMKIEIADLLYSESAQMTIELAEKYISDLQKRIEATTSLKKDRSARLSALKDKLKEVEDKKHRSNTTTCLSTLSRTKTPEVEAHVRLDPELFSRVLVINSSESCVLSISPPSWLSVSHGTGHPPACPGEVVNVKIAEGETIIPLLENISLSSSDFFSSADNLSPSSSTLALSASGSESAIFVNVNVVPVFEAMVPHSSPS
ncbi:hypothetical protein ADUPG1_009868, partial [Aduncisulcus paluster]